MSFFHALISQPPGDPYTTADGKQLILVLSDSMLGTSDGVGPTPTAGTVYEWDGSAETEVADSDVIQANTGSPWPQFGITYNTATSIKPVMCTYIFPGADVSPNGNDDNYSASGDLRALAETKFNSAIANYGVTPKVCFCCVGTNDLRGSVAIATILSDIDSFFTWFTTTYPDTDLVMVQVGNVDQVLDTPNTEGTARGHQIRARIKQNVISHARVHFFCNAGTIPLAGSPHFSQTGCNTVGNSAASWLINSTRSKWARSIIASHYTQPTSGQMDLIEAWVSAINYTTGLDSFTKWRDTTDEIDYYNDWGFETCPAKQNTLGTSADGFVGTAAGYLKTRFFGNSALLAGTDDFYCGVEVISQTGNSMLFGVRNPSTTAELSVQFASPNRNYRANDVTATSLAGDFTDGEAVYVARDGGNKYLVSDTTQDSTAAVASTAAISLELFVFGRNNNGSVDLMMTGTLGYWVYGKRSVLNSVFHDATQTLIDNW